MGNKNEMEENAFVERELSLLMQATFEMENELNSISLE
jgi:hypothetical protein